MVEIGQVSALILQFLSLEVSKQVQGHHATLVRVELDEVLYTIVDDFVNLEEEECFVAEELSRHIFIFVCVKHISICHGCEDGLDEVLEPLIDQMLLLFFEFSTPLLFAEVFLEILLNLAAD